MRGSPDPAWFKNARFRVTRGASARTLIGLALKWVYERESLVAVPGASGCGVGCAMSTAVTTLRVPEQ